MTVSFTLCDSSRVLIHVLLWMRDRGYCGIRNGAANGVESQPSQKRECVGHPRYGELKKKRERWATRPFWHRAARDHVFGIAENGPPHLTFRNCSVVQNNIQNNWDVKYCSPHAKGVPTVRQPIPESMFQNKNVKPKHSGVFSRSPSIESAIFVSFAPDAIVHACKCERPGIWRSGIVSASCRRTGWRPVSGAVRAH
jgi:hypothetical protein